MRMQLRPATKQDESALLRMMRLLAEQPPVIPFDENKVRAILHEFLEHSEFGAAWVLSLGEKIIGYIVLTHGYSFEYGGREAFIDEFYIETEFRRQGFGQQAMQFLEERAQEMGIKAIHLEVDYDNEPAMNLYRRGGYADNNRYLMTKWIRSTRH